MEKFPVDDLLSEFLCDFFNHIYTIYNISMATCSTIIYISKLCPNKHLPKWWGGICWINQFTMKINLTIIISEKMRIHIAILTIFIGINVCTTLKTGTDITVSGLSSGGFMAIQMHIANSATIRGAGVFAGGPYYCAKGSITTALTNCMYVGTNIDRAGIKAQIKNYEQSEKIDASSNLSKQKHSFFLGYLITQLFQK